MNIQVTCRHSKISHETKLHINNELSNLVKYYDRITSCHAILDSENLDKIAELVINVQGTTINAKAKSDNLGKAVDIALSKITRQLKKFNQKQKSHKPAKVIRTVAEDDEY